VEVLIFRGEHHHRTRALAGLARGKCASLSVE
jgi:hypothetical protein